MKTVGIIGGLGPETTAEFYLELIFQSQELNKAARPNILISNVPIGYELEQNAIGKGEGLNRILPLLVTEAQKLEEAGADFLVMPCNSLHIFIKELRESVSIPVLSIVEETTKFLINKKYKSVAIASTSITLKYKLYENAFKKEGLKFNSPDGLQQEKMGEYVLNLVNGKQSNRDREGLLKIINSFDENAIDCIILACTDLQLLLPKHSSLPIYDTMKIFAEATVREILN